MGTFLDHLKLNMTCIGFSKRLAIITVIGLSISIAMITQNILFLNSFRDNAFNEFSSSTTESYIAVNMDHVGTYGTSLITIIESAVDTQMEDVDFDEELYDQEWFTYKDFFLMLYNDVYHENEFHDTFLVGINSLYLESLAPLITEGSAPKYGEAVIITNTQTIEETNLNVNDTFEMYVPVEESGNPYISFNMGIGQAGAYIDFAGIINLDEIVFGSIELPPELQALISMALSLGSELIITDTLTCVSIVHNIVLSRNDISVSGRILFNLPAFNVFKLDDIISDLQIVVNNLQESLIEIISVFSNSYELEINSRIIPLLSTFKQEYRIFQIFILIFMLPTLGISLALTAFATNQVKKQRDLHINIMHQRGSSRDQLFSFMVFELIIYALLAVLIGFLIGWPYTMVAQKSDGFFSFGGAAAMSVPNIWIVVICLGVGFGIAILSNIFSLWKRTKTTIDEATQERIEKSPFWERFYIDVFILIIGTALWIIASSSIIGSSATAIEFAFFFAAPAPILIVTGTVMFATRLYPTIIKLFSDLLFKIPKMEISAISARNALRRKGSTNRTIILMTITFTLTVATIIIPDSYRAYDLESAYYTLGADIVVDKVDILNPNYKQTVEAIEGVEASTYVGILELSNSESDLVYTIKILGIELDNFSKVAYQEDEYTNNRQIENVLQSISNYTDVIGQKDQMDLLNLGENSTFIMENLADIGADVVMINYPVNFVDFYEYWPTLYTVQPSTISKEIHIGLLANISLPFHIARHQSDVQGKLLVKVKEGYSISEVAQTIKTTTRHETANVEDMLLISAGTLKATVLYGSLNTSFIISMLISAATLMIMMTVQAIEREKELAVMKSMGISFRQLFTFFFSEALVILIFTMIVGVSLGFGTSVMIMKVLRIGSVFPPHENIFPLANIAWTTLVIFGCGLVSTIIPIILNSRKKIGGALKAI